MLRWIGRRLRPGYGHVSVFVPDEETEAWIYVHPTAAVLWPKIILDGAEMQTLLRLLKPTEVLAIPYRPITDRYVFRGLWTCVTCVKAVIGVQDWKVITPWQLRSRFRYGFHFQAAENQGA